MERRAGDLERRMDRVESKLDTIVDTLAELKADIKPLPGKGFVISTAIAIVGLVIGAIALAPYLRAAA